MSEPIRIPPEEVRQKVLSGSTLLVCAYDDDEKFKKMHLEGAISFSKFKSKITSLSKEQEIIFYWAWPKEASAAGRAVKYIEEGFRKVRVLGGGVEDWKKAGYPVY